MTELWAPDAPLERVLITHPCQVVVVRLDLGCKHILIQPAPEHALVSGRRLLLDANDRGASTRVNA